MLNEEIERSDVAGDQAGGPPRIGVHDREIARLSEEIGIGLVVMGVVMDINAAERKILKSPYSEIVHR